MSDYFRPVISLEKTAANIKRARKAKGYTVKAVAEKDWIVRRSVCLRLGIGKMPSRYSKLFGDQPFVRYNN